MKFGNLLRCSAETNPQLLELFKAYKQAKKKIKMVVPPGAPDQGVASTSQAEASFVDILSADVQQFNDLFIEREEDAVIKLGAVEEAASAATTPEEIAQVYRRSVNLHGQLLLLVHWSILAYTGLVKILKKHNKRTGTPIQAPQLDNLLSQPFCSVELLSQLVRQTETTSQQLADRLRSQGRAAEVISTRSSNSSIDELILAARSSVQELAADSVDEAGPAAATGPLLGALGQPAAKRQRTEPAADQQPASLPAEAPAQAPSAAAPAAEPAPPASQPQPQPQQAPQSELPAQPAAASASAGQTPADPASTTTASPAAQDAAARARLATSGPSASGATILRQTQAALGLWESLHGNAATPSTVLQPHRVLRRPAQPTPAAPAPRAQSVSNSA